MSGPCARSPRMLAAVRIIAVRVVALGKRRQRLARRGSMASSARARMSLVSPPASSRPARVCDQAAKMGGSAGLSISRRHPSGCRTVGLMPQASALRDAEESCRRQSGAAPHPAATSRCRSTPARHAPGTIVKDGAGRCAAITASTSFAVIAGTSPEARRHARAFRDEAPSAAVTAPIWPRRARRRPKPGRRSAAPAAASGSTVTTMIPAGRVAPPARRARPRLSPVPTLAKFRRRGVGEALLAAVVSLIGTTAQMPFTSDPFRRGEHGAR